MLERRPELVPPGTRVLHVGPEPSMQLALRRHGELDYVAVDLDHPLATAEMDVRRMTFADASFDVALCFHVLVLLPDEQEALRELVRVLAPAGLLMVTDPPDRPGYPAALADHPLDVEAVRTDTLCTPSEIERYGLLSDERIYLCRRR
jgi:SAM-dependent methyltransferase